MGKRVLAGASSKKQKYFFSPEFEAIPQQVRDEIKTVCIIMAERLNCTFVISFEESGDLLFEIMETDAAFDDIGAELEIKSLRSEKKELIKALKLWYIINMTPEGGEIKKQLLEK